MSSNYISHSPSGKHGGTFDIWPDGEIKLLKQVDREDVQEFVINVTVTDTAGHQVSLSSMSLSLTQQVTR